jgi:hypothetical protein
MSAPTTLEHVTTAPYGSTNKVRAELYDALHLMRLRIDAAMIGIESGDDFALVRSLRLHALHLDHGLGLLVQIEEEKARDRERRDLRRRQQQPHERAIA